MTMPEYKMTPQDMKGAKDAIHAVINVPPGKCKACYYNQLIHEGVISHISPIPLHTCEEERIEYQERVDKAAETYANSYNSYVDFDVDFKYKSDFQYEGKKAVAAQAEAIREALKLFRATVWTEQYLLEHGYIEPKTEEDGK